MACAACMTNSRAIRFSTYFAVNNTVPSVFPRFSLLDYLILYDVKMLKEDTRKVMLNPTDHADEICFLRV